MDKELMYTGNRVWVRFFYKSMVFVIFLGCMLIAKINDLKKAHAATPDPCRQYHEKAIENINSRFNDTKAAAYSIAYNLLYQNCRDHNRQK